MCSWESLAKERHGRVKRSGGFAEDSDAIERRVTEKHRRAMAKQRGAS